MSEMTHAPDGSHAGDDPAIFAFERDFADSLRCIPMSVRLKLDSVGIKLSLKHWNRLPAAERSRLLHLPCEAAAQREAFRQELMQMLQGQAGAPPRTLPVEPQPPWEEQHQVPEQLQAYLAQLQLPALSLAQWRALRPVQRFALLKLSRPAHDNDNFVPALREFGLLPA
ncbi:MAG TPA: nitrate reductase associated protein [Steroidobacteraceae bacterium]|nr:nitrate reductase associated protein [Steroidobacteraceae bacterium]